MSDYYFNFIRKISDMDNFQYQEYQELFGKQCSFAKQCPADKKDI